MSGVRPDQQPLRVEEWSLARIADAVEGAVDGDSERQPTGVSSDSRDIEPGELFIALEGERFDGHEYVEDAAAKGACGAVVRSDWRANGREMPVVRVSDTRAALADLGAAIWRDASEDGLHTVDVTGSNGKTTTKEFLAAIWSTQGHVFSTPGNFNNDIGLPLTLCGLPANCDHLILELGANAPGEISELVRLAPGRERVVTSIGRDHLGGFGSVSGVRAAKSEIFECADAETVAVVPYAERNHLDLEPFDGEISTFGDEAGADLQLVAFEASADETTSYGARYRVSEASYRFELPVPGRFNALNLGCALSTLLGCGADFDRDAIQEALHDVELPGGRWRDVRRGDLLIVDDAYNANPTSVRASFRAFMEMDAERRIPGEPRRIAVLGDMRELGEGAERWHQDVANELAEDEELDVLICVGEYANELKRGGENAGGTTEVRRFDDMDALAGWLADREPACVWLKASRANRLERVLDRLPESNEDV